MTTKKLKVNPSPNLEHVAWNVIVSILLIMFEEEASDEDWAEFWTAMDEDEQSWFVHQVYDDLVSIKKTIAENQADDKIVTRIIYRDEEDPTKSYQIRPDVFLKEVITEEEEDITDGNTVTSTV